MKYINQLEYPHIPYPTRVKQAEYAPHGMNTTVKSSACGLRSVCMAIDLLTDTTLDIEECVRISCDCVANHSRGTDMNILGPVIAEKFGINYSKTSDLSEAIRHIQAGGVVVVHVGVPEGKEIGLFTKGGHYIALIASDGETFTILDPSYKAGKFDIPERAGKVDERCAPILYCDVHTVHAEMKPNRIKYHMFEKQR